MPSSTMPPDSHSTIFALDFDGVLCDSAVETAVTAWRAGRLIWSEWRGLEPPSECLNRFQILRPVIETGYQTLLLMRLIWLDQQPNANIASHFVELSETLMKTGGHLPAQLVEIFGQARDSWIDDDPDDWFSRQKFYPEILKTFAKVLQQGSSCYILTTKQERFVRMLLQQAGIDFPAEHLFGLESNRPKEAMLEQLLRAASQNSGTIHFVEDRLATLVRMAMKPNLSAVRLYLADWGYNTLEQRCVAQQHPRITVWNSKAFLQV